MWMRMGLQDHHILHRDAVVEKAQEAVQMRVYLIRIEDPISQFSQEM